MGSAIAKGDDQSHHSFASDTPNQGAQVPQNLFSNLSSADLAAINPAATSAASPSQLNSSIQPSGISTNKPVFSPTNTPVIVLSATPANVQGVTPQSNTYMVLVHLQPYNTVISSNNKTDYYHIVGTGKYSFCNYGCGIFTPISYFTVACTGKYFFTSMSYAPDVQRRFEKILDLKMPTMDNILEFWSQVDDPLYSEEMVLSKMSIVAKKAIGLMHQNKQPNIGGHLFTMEECRDWYVNPLITKEVLSHLVSVKEGDEDSDRFTKQMNLVEVIFDQKMWSQSWRRL